MFKKLFFVLTILIISSSILSAQVPDKFTNLKVLPKDIQKKDLVDLMKNFTGALGVRCSFCHDGEEGQPLDTYDFASDKKTAKNKARIMMAMTRDINKKYLSKLSEYSENILDVKCATCHRGAQEPKTLEQVLMSVISREGTEEAINTYHNLYKRYYGGPTYDFRDHTLVSVTEQLILDKKLDDAMKFANLNLEQYPNSGVAHIGMGEVYEEKGDKISAVTEYKKAVELMPQAQRFLGKKIQELEGK